MSIEGRIAIDVSFSDSTSASGVQSLKRIALTSTDSYSTGKVALVSGTVGTAAVAVGIFPSAYKDASGSAVSFQSVQRVALSASGTAGVAVQQAGTPMYVISRSSRIAVSEGYGESGEDLSVEAVNGTATFTLVVYGT